MQTDIDSYLIDQCLKKDERAAFQLYSKYAKAMFQTCYRFTREESSAQDLLQEAFAEAFLRLHTFRRESTFGTWMKRIVVNRCINFIQKKKLLTKELNERIDLPEEDSEDLSEEEFALEMRKVRSAIDELPEGARTVLMLYLFEGYDHQEIGGILGITESTSKAQYSKARKRLREQLQLMREP